MTRTARSRLVAALVAAMAFGAVAAGNAGAAPYEPGVTMEGNTVGDPGTAQPASIGGTDAKVSEYPPIIAQSRKGGVRPEEQSCSGSLIAPKKVLLAAHCYGSDLPGAKYMIYGLDDLKDYKGGSGTGFQAANVVSQKIHPKYTRFDQSGYDIAIATLDKEIKPLNGVFAKWATSADKNVNLTGRNGLGFGYGKKDVNDNTKDVTLDKFELPIRAGTGNECRGVGNFNNTTMICVGYANGRPVTVLPGDSGGPLLVDGKIFGICSWGSGSWNWWNVYTRLNMDGGDWITQQVR